MNLFPYNLFIKVVNMSITSTYIIFAVLIIRLLLKKTPKIYSYMLWLVVLFRLICPVSFSSVISIFNLLKIDSVNHMPARYSVASPSYAQSSTQSFNIDTVINPNTPVQTYIDYARLTISILSIIWMIGIAMLLVYSIISYLKLRRKTSTSVILTDNIYQADDIATAFVIGIIKPKVYIPFNLDANEKDYIISHELTHLKRHDNIIKLIYFIALCIHWFNPLVWLSFILMSKDMEMSCDEAVLKSYNYSINTEYSSSLLNLAVKRNILSYTPLAFGENSIKSRIKNILKYKKPTVAISILCIIVVVICLISFTSNPLATTDIYDINALNAKMNENVTSVTLMNGRDILKLSSNDEINNAIKQIEAIRLDKKELSISRSENRPYAYSIRVAKSEEINYVICLSEDFTEMWVDNGVKPSFTYRIKNSKNLKTYFTESFSTHLLTMDKVKELSKKGNDLTWEDFNGYKAYETGSGLYILEFDINEDYTLWIGGTPNNNPPMYIYLTHKATEAKIDIREDDIDEFLDKTSSYMLQIKQEFMSYPSELNEKAAAKLNLFVHANGKIISGQSLMDRFISDYNNKRPSSITLATFTTEGDAIIEKLTYDGSYIYSVTDQSRDKFKDKSSDDYIFNKFMYLKIFEANNSVIAVLLDDDTVTYEELFNSMLSSDSNIAFSIKNHILYYIKK